MSGRGLLRDPPPIRADRARRNQNKYCNFHKDVGHDTKDCIQLRDQIELLIWDGHLQEFVEKIITPAGVSNRAALTVRPNPGLSNRREEPEQEHIIHTIFSGTATVTSLVAGEVMPTRLGGLLAENTLTWRNTFPRYAVKTIPRSPSRMMRRTDYSIPTMT